LAGPGIGPCRQLQGLTDRVCCLVGGAFGIQTEAFGDQGGQLSLLVAAPFALHIGGDLA